MSPRLPFLLLLAGVTAVGARTAWQDRTADGPGEGDGLSTPASPATEPELATEGGSSPGGEPGPSTWYCAAGTAGGLADHVVVVINPTDRSVGASLTVFFEDGPSSAAGPAGSASQPYRIAVPAGEELRIGLAGFERHLPVRPPSPPSTAEANTMPDEELPPDDEPSAVPDISGETFLAALVEVDEAPAEAGPGRKGVRVEHEVSGPHGATSGPCAPRGAPTWHFAWGRTTRDARDLLVLFNPFPSDVVVDGQFSTPDGLREPVRWQGLTVPGRTVVAVEVGADVTRREHVAATVRTRAGSLVVERLQTFDGSLDMEEGMRLALGQPRAAYGAGFPGGANTAGDSELIVLYNPTGDVAEVNVAVRPEDPAVPRPLPFHVVVQPERFETLNYAQESRVPSGKTYTTVVRSTNGVPIISEQVLTN